VAERFGAMRFIKTRHRVDHGEWDDAAKKWFVLQSDPCSTSYSLTCTRRVKVTNLATGETFEDAANVLITARGQLNNVSWPNIPGLDTFQGKVMHSGEWDTR
jgi:cation diffusion facilitator CzcD-associated flavoprotein CzcO